MSFPKPILGVTEEQTQNTDTDASMVMATKHSVGNVNTKRKPDIFRSNDNIIPDMPNGSSTPERDNMWSNEALSMSVSARPGNVGYKLNRSHSLNTNPNISLFEDNDTIANIVNKLDNPSITKSHSSKSEYVTFDKLNTLLGEMRGDILHLVNLITVLNNTISEQNTEITHMKESIIRLETQTSSIDESLNEFQETTEQSFDDLQQTYDSQIKDLQKTLGIQIERGITDGNNVNNNSNNNNKYRIVKKRTGGDLMESVNDNDEATKIKNELADSQMDKKASLFKTSLPRSRNMGDMFGTQIKKESETIIHPSYRKVERAENIDKNAKTQASTRSIRAKRLNLPNLVTK